MSEISWPRPEVSPGFPGRQGTKARGRGRTLRGRECTAYPRRGSVLLAKRGPPAWGGPSGAQPGGPQAAREPSPPPLPRRGGERKTSGGGGGGGGGHRKRWAAGGPMGIREFLRLRRALRLVPPPFIVLRRRSSSAPPPYPLTSPRTSHLGITQGLGRVRRWHLRSHRERKRLKANSTPRCDI